MMNKITDTVKHLIIINVIFWLGALTIGNYGDVFRNLFAMHFPQNDLFQPWQIITHMFMHATYVGASDGGSQIFFFHILFNMLGLWMFGSPIEQILGKKKFLFFYISCGLGAVLLPLIIDLISFSNLINPLLENGVNKNMLFSTLNKGMYNTGWLDFINESDNNSISNIFRSTSVGASGCVMGLLVAYGMMFPNNELMLIFLPIPIKAKYFIPLVLAYEIISGFTGGSSMFGVNINHWAHVGGAITGFLIMWYWKKTQFNKNRWN